MISFQTEARESWFCQLQEWRLPCLHTVIVPEGVDWKAVQATLFSKGIEVAGGLGATLGKIFRIGTFGANSEPEKAKKIIAEFIEVLKSQSELWFARLCNLAEVLHSHFLRPNFKAVFISFLNIIISHWYTKTARESCVHFIRIGILTLWFSFVFVELASDDRLLHWLSNNLQEKRALEFQAFAFLHFFEFFRHYDLQKLHTPVFDSRNWWRDVIKQPDSFSLADTYWEWADNNLR